MNPESSCPLLQVSGYRLQIMNPGDPPFLSPYWGKVEMALQPVERQDQPLQAWREE